LTTYDNGIESGVESIEENFKRLQNAYGEEIQFLGVRTNCRDMEKISYSPYAENQCESG
jgi:hypothetical protein